MLLAGLLERNKRVEVMSDREGLYRRIKEVLPKGIRGRSDRRVKLECGHIVSTDALKKTRCYECEKARDAALK